MANILFVGVFDTSKKSTNTSQLLSFKKSGHNVTGYNYRKKALEIGNEKRDEELVNLVKNKKFDLVVYSKCNVVSERVFIENSKISKTCLWFMDSLINFDDEMKQKTRLVDYFCCDKENVLTEALKINKKSTKICEGYDETVDKPYDLEKEYNISFIGNLYGERADFIDKINKKVHIFSNIYGSDHAKTVSKSWINLNICTNSDASDRVYKILASGGFLLTNDWVGRADNFRDGKDLMIYKDLEDLKSKIDYCLNNKLLLNKISTSGKNKVKKYSRLNWAINLVNFCNEK